MRVTSARSAGTPVPYLLHVQLFDREAVAVLPSSDAALVFHDGGAHPKVVALPPHGSVVVLDEVVAVWSLSPNIIKAMIGPPASVRGAVVRASDHPALRLFAQVDGDRDALPLLHDLRSAITVTPDEREFEVLWRAYKLDQKPLPQADRRVQRLMLRFAGQTLSQIAAVDRLAATVQSDRETGRSNSLGLFADGSHYARSSRRLTGQSPSYWRNVSLPFYGGLPAQPYGGGEAPDGR